MRIKQVWLRAIVFSLALMAGAGFPATAVAAGTANRSGIVLTAHVVLPCNGVVWIDATCTQPYLGEFVVTAPNGAEITRVRTNFLGQAVINLAPGRYLVGARTESIYPRTVPALVEVAAERYTYVSLRVELGPGRQLLSR